MKTLRIYLDNCCFNRPYDDQSSLPVYLETQAKLHIQQKVRNQEIELIWPFILTAENEANPDNEIRDKIADCMDLAVFYVQHDLEIEAYATNLMERHGIDAKDALHVACAVRSGCDFLLTTDKKLIRRTGRVEQMQIINPVIFVADCAEYIKDEK
jgi:predicted nucleic acid-binding protein